MSHFGKAGPPDIRDTFSLLVLNISFRTTADDLFPLFERYGKVVDVFIPKDRRTGDSRGFAFVRYKYADEAQKAVERLDGRTVYGREIMVQFAKYGPNAERMYREHYRDKYYRRSRSKSPDRYSRDKYRERERESRRRSRSASPYHSRDRRRGRYEDERRSRSRSYERRSSSPMRSPLPLKASPRDVSPDGRKRSPTPNSVSPHRRPAASRSPYPRHLDAEVIIVSSLRFFCV
uniref:RRM domain-containing protein n=1 Tax=Kalanchoe fedtschenkoi TaxID=63787 RepID=A0A7N0VAH6_KALFE